MASRQDPRQGNQVQLPDSPHPGDEQYLDIARGPRRARRQVSDRNTPSGQGNMEGYSAQAGFNGNFPQPQFRSAFQQLGGINDDDDSDVDNNTFAFEGASGDEEQFEFAAGSGDELIQDLMDDAELGAGHMEDEDHQVELDQIPVNFFDPVALGLKEINNLARFRVSTYKPGNGVQELLSDDLDKYWQSDGTQPHRLTIKFIRMVEIRALRFYVDYNQDESYTPTHILWFAGTGEHNLIQFAESALTNPNGWQDVQVAGSGGGNDGNSLCAFVVQMQVKENHQNGKDTHIRGIKVYGFDERADPGEINAVHEMSVDIDAATDRATELRLEDDEDEEALFYHRVDSIERSQNAPRYKPGEGGLSIPDFMQDPIIR